MASTTQNVTSHAKSLAEECPQLFHYTSAAGLAGILKSQTLRATNYAYLNDTEEVRHFLSDRLPTIFASVIQEQGETEIKSRQLAGSLAAKFQSRLLSRDMASEPLAEPYITSFCTPSNSRVEAHGLLSQWRAYGKDGGFAIVFDTETLGQQLKEFSRAHTNFGDLFAGKVVYSSDSEEVVTREFEKDILTIRQFLSCQLLGKDDSEILPHIFVSIMRCACRYKHWGFKEENEVRLIFVPNSREVSQRAKLESIPIKEAPTKHFLRSGTHVPYVDLLEVEGVASSTRHLPIRRIIVGPCANHERANRVRAVEVLLRTHNMDAKVTASEIPYIEQ